jgi:hypothetical protein
VAARLRLAGSERRSGPVAHRRGAVVIVGGGRAVERGGGEPAFGIPVEGERVALAGGAQQAAFGIVSVGENAVVRQIAGRVVVAEAVGCLADRVGGQADQCQRRTMY